MKKVVSKGFTLIELLVVIAIIGILASIVLVSLNSARSKGKDTRLISNGNQIRTEIESEATSGGSYQIGSAYCVTAPPGTINTAASMASTGSNPCASLYTDTNSTAGSVPKININATTGAASFTSYAVFVPLTTGYYCVDSTGKTSTATTTIPTTGVTCP